MAEITRILEAIDEGDAHAAEELLPHVYGELRRLAAQKLSQEKPGQTLQGTALVHEAYIQLVASDDQHKDGRGHFFAAAAEVMQRIRGTVFQVGDPMRRQLLWILPVVLLLATVSSASTRKWTDHTGRYSVDAELVKVKDGKAWLKKRDGKVIDVPMTKLSKVDRDHIDLLADSDGAADGVRLTRDESH